MGTIDYWYCEFEMYHKEEPPASRRLSFLPRKGDWIVLDRKEYLVKWCVVQESGQYAKVVIAWT